jgi:F-type H+-transporting ATPase subunit delta
MANDQWPAITAQREVMADNDFQVESIGEIYAQALINEAQKQHALEQVTDDVRGIGEVLKTNAMFRRFTEALMVGEEERLAALDKIFGGRVHELTLATLKSLARRDRFMFLGGFVQGFDVILKKMSGHMDVELVTPVELKPEVLERVKQAVGQSIGKTPDVKVTIDPALIGGMTLRIGDTLIDGSVATQLGKMEDALKKRGLGQLDVAAATA